MLAGNGRAQRDNSICRTIMRVSTSNQTLPLSYFALVFPTRDQSGCETARGQKPDNNYLSDTLRYARYPTRLPHPDFPLPLFFSHPPFFFYSPRRSTDYRRALPPQVRLPRVDANELSRIFRLFFICSRVPGIYFLISSDHSTARDV